MGPSKFLLQVISFLLLLACFLGLLVARRRLLELLLEFGKDLLLLLEDLLSLDDVLQTDIVLVGEL